MRSSVQRQRASERERTLLREDGLFALRRGGSGYDSQVLMILKFRGDEL